MRAKLNMLAIKAHLRVSSFIADFKKDERGLSGTVVAVLLILVAVLAVILIWDRLEDWLGNLFDTITKKADGID